MSTRSRSSAFPMSQDVSTLPIPPFVLTNITRAGLTRADEILSLNSSVLSKDANITEEQSSAIIQIAQEQVSSLSPKPQSVWELFQKEQESPSIVTFCECLDDLLDGGVPLKKITEFCGTPGSGKTQMCLQLCTDVQIPMELGGQEGEAIYIDTEGSFILDRVKDIAQATIHHCQTIAGQTEKNEKLADFTVEKILHGIHYFRCLDQCEMLAIIHQISELVQTHPKVKLLIIDNIASPLRQNLEDLLLHNQLVSYVGQSLIKIAAELDIAVVLTNQMTTRIDAANDKAHIVPALGEIWSHIINIRVILSSSQNYNKAFLYKSINKKEEQCHFLITANGIRDEVNLTLNDTQPTSSSSTSASQIRMKSEREERNDEEDKTHNPSKKTRIK